MSNVLVDKQKIDILANAISDKSGVPVTMTLDEMVEAVDSIEAGGGEPTLQAKTYTVDSAGTATVTADSGYDGLSEVEVSVPSAYATAGSVVRYITQDNTRKWKWISEAYAESGGWVDEGVIDEKETIYNAVPSNTVVNPTESSQTIGGANYMMEGAVTVNAIPSNYVGTGITRRSSTDLTASGATVTVPSGYYSAQASKAVASGTVTAPASITGTSATVSTGTNTLTLSKTVSVTPSVTTAGYVSSGTAGNSSVSLTASVTTQAAQTIYPSASDQTINSGRYLTGTQTIKGVTTTNLTADNIKSGVTVQIGDSADSDRVASVTGTYTGGGGTSKNVQVLQSTSRTNASSLTKVLGDLTVSKTGTYDVYWSGGRSNTSTSYTWGTRLYVDGTGYGTENTSWTNNCQSNHLSNVSLTVNQKLSVYARGRTGSYYTFAPMLVIIEA